VFTADGALDIRDSRLLFVVRHRVHVLQSVGSPAQVHLLAVQQGLVQGLRAWVCRHDLAPLVAGIGAVGSYVTVPESDRDEHPDEGTDNTDRENCQRITRAHG
jgi:hypothetical protein